MTPSKTSLIESFKKFNSPSFSIKVTAFIRIKLVRTVKLKSLTSVTEKEFLMNLFVVARNGSFSFKIS